MTWKQIEASREARLWVAQVVIPTLIGVGAIMANPEARAKVATTMDGLKQTIRCKFKKG